MSIQSWQVYISCIAKSSLWRIPSNLDLRLSKLSKEYENLSQIGDHQARDPPILRKGLSNPRNTMKHLRNTKKKIEKGEVSNPLDLPLIVNLKTNALLKFLIILILNP